MKWRAELNLAVEAARLAGECSLSGFRGEQCVLSMEGRDIKLQADRDAEALILAKLKDSRYPVLAEESGEHGDIADDTPFWIVDPLDGTLNFSRGIPICSVAISLSTRNERLLGVIYDFNRDEMFTGVVGEGAWCDGVPMHVSTAKDPAQAILVTGLPTAAKFDDESLSFFVRQLRRFKKTRLLGSAAIMLAYVACGRVDAYAEDEIMFWDVAAGMALVEAAGGWVHMEDSKRLKWARIVRCASDGALWA